MRNKIMAFFLFFIIGFSGSTCAGCSIKSSTFLKILRFFCPCYGSSCCNKNKDNTVNCKLSRKSRYKSLTTILRESKESNNLAGLVTVDGNVDESVKKNELEALREQNCNKEALLKLDVFLRRHDNCNFQENGHGEPKTKTPFNSDADFEFIAGEDFDILHLPVVEITSGFEWNPNSFVSQDPNCYFKTEVDNEKN